MIEVDEAVSDLGHPDKALGWVRFWRSLLDDERFTGLPLAHQLVALHLLRLAAYRETTVAVGPAEICLRPGEAVVVCERMARRIGHGTTRHVVRRALGRLAGLGFLEFRRLTQKVDTEGSKSARPARASWRGRGVLVTISNWTTYYGNGDNESASPRADRTQRRRESRSKRATCIGEGRTKKEEGSSGSVSKVEAAVPPAVLVVFVEEFDREPTLADRAVMAQLGGFPLDAVRAAFRETRERGLDLTYAQAVLRFTPGTAATEAEPAGGAA